MKKLRVTEYDVAKAAGVSHNTVSLVMRDSPLVRPETKERVRKVIAELGYRRNAVATTLVSAQSQTIGYLLPQDTRDAEIDVFHNKILKSITICAEQHNYYVLLDHFIDAERCLALANSGRIDGLLVDMLIPDTIIKTLVAQRLPLVLVGRSAADSAVSWVRADEAEGTHQAIKQLIADGHRRIAFVTAGEPEHVIVQQRELGYRRALSDAQIDLPASFVARGDWTYESGYALCHQLLSQPTRPTALFIVSELMASAALQVAHDLGLRVPHDVAIVTVGDSIWVRYVNPPLSSVHVPMDRVGQAAAEVLFEQLQQGREQPRQITVPTELILRASTTLSSAEKS